MKNKKEKSPCSWKHTVLIIVCCVLALILAVLIFAVVYLDSIFGLMGRVDPNQSQTLSPEELEALMSGATDDPSGYTGAVIDPSDVTWNTEATEPLEQGEHIVNILLIGQDRRAGQGRQRSDVIILCTINKSAKTLTLTSFMRDLYVQIPGYADNRINTAYALGDMKLLDETLEKNFGVQVDGNIEVDFSGFVEVIDQVGGIDMELSAAEAKYLNTHNWKDIPGSAQWNLTAGVNHLDGAQALAYARTRAVGRDDFERTDRQRRVISAVLKKCRGMNLTQLDKLLRSILPNLRTDMRDTQIFGYALEFFPMLSNLTVNNVRIPEEGTYTMAMIKGMAVLVPDREAIRARLAETVFMTAE